jgi:hypothetical protein
MRRSRQGYYPEIRQLLILNMLKRVWPNGIPPAELRDCLHDYYPGDNREAIHRRFSDDMRALHAAGLITYNHLRPSSTVKLAVQQKDRSLSFDAEEHRALFAARDRLRWRPAPSPIDAGSGAPKLDLMLRAVRLMEEQTVDVSEIAEALNVRPSKVREVMNRIDGVRPQSELLTELVEIERDEAGDRPIAGHVRTGLAGAPLRGRGLDEIGLFAYSRAEVADRLALITTALSRHDIPNADIRPLRSAEDKLQLWRQKLATNQKLWS